MMKFAICNEMFECWNTASGFDFARFCRFSKECGYEGIEIAPFTIASSVYDIPTEKRSEIRKIAESAGLQITGLHWLLAKTTGFHLTSPDAEVRRKTATYFQELIRLCADLGGQFMVLGSPNQRTLQPGISKEQGEDHAAEILRTILPQLEKSNVKIAIEPLTTNETDFWNSAEEVVDFVRRLDASEHVALHLDCKAMCGEQRPIPEIICQSKDDLIYVHVNDPNLQGPGFGDLKFDPILAALEEIEYDGWLSLETFDYSPGPEVLARKSLEYLKSLIPDPVTHS
ncbi:MAG: sugar phosphate isomerase/epimerase [Planctomycetaceae bacterium]|nr:sugar phosphate isomerase/epimerase [Planctomycetaceae bacterium]